MSGSVRSSRMILRSIESMPKPLLFLLDFVLSELLSEDAYSLLLPLAVDCHYSYDFIDIQFLQHCIYPITLFSSAEIP